MDIRILREEDEPLYDSYVSSHPNSTIYHSLEWRDILRDVYGYKPLYVTAKQSSDLHAIIPMFEVSSYFYGKKLISLPYSHSVSLLYDDDAALSEAIELVEETARAFGYEYIELRRGDENLMPANWVSRSDNYISVLNLERPLDQIYDLFDRNISWGIGKAKRSGLEIRVASTLEEYEIFYELEASTRKRQGAPVYSVKLFKKIHELLQTHGMCSLYLCFHESIPIAGLLILYSRKHAIAGYAASLDDKRYLSYQPNKLLFWEAIQKAHEAGFVAFDFGTTPKWHTGLLRFKNGWGCTTRELYYYYCNTSDKEPRRMKRDSWKARFGSGVLKRMPMPLFKNIGPFLLKELGQN